MKVYHSDAVDATRWGTSTRNDPWFVRIWILLRKQRVLQLGHLQLRQADSFSYLTDDKEGSTDSFTYFKHSSPTLSAND